MAPTLILIRHAQALHNVADDWDLRDPPLSELGETQQCAELQEALNKSELANKVELIVVSAMRRTLQTATLGLAWLIERGVKVLPDAGWQENSDKPCDTGSSIDIMAKEFPQLDFSSVDPLYPDKTTSVDTNPYAFTQTAIIARGQSCLKALYDRPEKVIAAVSHSGFLRCGVSNRRYFNADYRIFTFDEEAMKKSKEKGEGIDGQGLFILKESQETEERGGGLGKSEKGIFGIKSSDFPPVTENEPTAQVPEAVTA